MTFLWLNLYQQRELGIKMINQKVQLKNSNKKISEISYRILGFGIYTDKIHYVDALLSSLIVTVYKVN